MKKRWAGHIGTMSDNHGTKRYAELQSDGARRPGRPRRRLRNDIEKAAGMNWLEETADREE